MLAIFALILVFQARSVAAADEDYVYKVAKGDTLIGLTARLLKVPQDWPNVARYNRLRDPHRIAPGMTLRIPLAFLNHTLVPVTVTQVQGDVKASVGADVPPSIVALGAKLAEGAKVVTGKDGYATLMLPDGSIVRLQTNTELQVERQRAYTEVGVLESLMKVISGRVTSLVQKKQPDEKKDTRHGVKTPVADLAVRGTEFRVTMDLEKNETRGEVLAGTVAVAAEGAAANAKRLTAGFGSVVDANKSVSDPIALLSAPDVRNLPQLLERPLVRFVLPPLVGARLYRAQIASDEAFNAVVSEIVSPLPELRVTGLADGNYYLQVRAVDIHGLEGRDVRHAFTLKARPEPPLVTMPRDNGKVRAASVAFAWSENTMASAYHLQVAKEAAFANLVHEEKVIKGVKATVEKLALGDYYWRVASVLPNGDRGPFGDVSRLTLSAPPAIPEAPRVGDNSIDFRWAGEPGQTFEFQLADNVKFENPRMHLVLPVPQVSVPLQPVGEYFMRYRAIDADGFVGPYISAQKFSVPRGPYAAEFVPLYTHP